MAEPTAMDTSPEVKASPATPATAPAAEGKRGDVSTAGPKAGLEEKQFRLGATLGGHISPIRDVACIGNDIIGVAEERNMIGIWERKGDNEWKRANVATLAEPLHTGKVYLFSIEHTTAKCYPPNTFITGGGDKVARPFTSDGRILEPLLAHNGNVNSFSHTTKGELITGSWEGIARVFRNSRVHRQMEGGMYATEVLGLPTGEIVTGSANCNIVIYRDDKMVKTITKAHEQPIRKMVVHPLGFATVGNDGVIKIWSNTGDSLMTIIAHPDSLVYGLCRLPTGELVSSAEDGEVRIWKEDGRLFQTISCPGPVRGVRALPNGDLLMACADRCARIFTRDPSRLAPELELTSFEELTALAKHAGMGTLDASTLPDESALLVHGKKEGETKVVNVKGKGAQVFQWSEEAREWKYVGDAIGQAAGGGGGGGAPTGPKVNVDGVEYDFATDVYVTDDYKVKLGFNRDDDPYEVATNFCTVHGLPPDYIKEQIISHVRPMTDAAAYKRRMAAKAKSDEERKLIHVPSWNSGGFEVYATCKVSAMQAAILKINGELKEAKNDHIMVDSDMASFDRLIINITDSTNYHAAPFSDGENKLVLKLLQWPSDKILPVLDCVRVLMCHSAAVAALAMNPAVHRAIFTHAKGGPTHASLVLKILTNWVAKRRRDPSERNNPPSIPKDVAAFLMESLDSMADCSSSDQENVLLSYVMFLHNVMSWFGRLQIRDSDFYPLVATAVCELLSRPQKPKVLFHGLLTLGSIAFASVEAKKMIQDAFADQVIGFVRAGIADSNKNVQEVAHDLRKIFGFTL